MHALALLLVLGLSLAGCSDAPKPEPAKKPAAPAAPKPAPPPSAAPATSTAAAAKGSVLEEARKRTLTKDDFTESDSNRDPFRSFLSSFAVQVVVNKQHKIILEKFALDELRLAGVITGEIQPRAMFIDPSGQGVTVVRGDHLSKADALVTRVAADRVYLRIEEDTGSDKPRVTERQIELHAGELTAQ
jgi:type IV pilus assembly protein PilP